MRRTRAVVVGIVAALLAVLLAVPLAPASPAAAAAADVTADIVANRDVTLTGDAVVRLGGGVTTYTGVLSGEGTFTVSGSGTLVLTRDSDFTVPRSRQRQKLVTYNGNHPITRLDNPDPPAVIVERGATLQYGPGDGASGSIGHYVAVPGFSWNTLNHQVDGTLDIAVHRQVHLGVMSGSGLISARPSTWPGIALAGSHPFAGTLVNGTGFDYGTNAYTTALPNVRAVVNLGSAIHGAPDGTVVLDPAAYYSKRWGSDINYHTWGTGVVRSTGVYSWSDNDSVTSPALSNPALNFTTVAKNPNKRGVNIEGANVEWGDGTTNRFFLPGNKNTVYINLHDDGRERSRLTFNYNGPVTLAAPISGGRYHDTFAAAGQGDVVIAATRGNAVTFSAPQNYNGSTTIGAGASLRLGDGTPDGDSALLLGERFQIVDDGELIIQNTKQGISLGKISGAGSLRQAGAATTTLTGQLTYRGQTTIAAGTLAVTGGTLAASGAVNLTAPGARLDLTRAGEQTVNNLTGVAGTTVAAGGALTVNATAATAYAGSITAAGNGVVIKTGPETLTLSGVHATPGSTWTVRAGTLRLGAPEASIRAAALTVDKDGTLDATGTVEASLTNGGAVTAHRLTVHGGYTQRPGAVLTADHLTVAGPITLAGTLRPAPDQTATVIDNTGDAPVSGTFEGLPEGAAVGGWTITYRGGDGNDVVLVGAPADSTGGTRPAGASRSASRSGAVLLLTAVGAVLLAAAVVVVLRRRRRS